ncbi:MAG: translation initiation factor [Patescibacteria group bacterium]|nr:translation initiation factor [Patescibacteria group bacterium]
MGSIPIISTRASFRHRRISLWLTILAISTIIINTKIIRRSPYKKPFFKKREPRTRINDYIRAPQIRVVDDSGNQLGIMPPSQALALAKEKELDLVEIAPNAKPPVCRIMDFGKYQYQKSREERQNRARQKKVDIKGIRIGVRTDDHDLGFKKDQAEKFLKKGHKLKLEIRLRGREKAHQDLARKNLVEFIKTIEVPNKLEQEVKRFPGGFNAIIAPQ